MRRIRPPPPRSPRERVGREGQVEQQGPEVGATAQGVEVVIVSHELRIPEPEGDGPPQSPHRTTLVVPDLSLLGGRVCYPGPADQGAQHGVNACLIVWEVRRGADLR